MTSALHAAPLAPRSSASIGTFVEFDERLVAASPGIVLIRAPRAAHPAVLAHASRRLRANGLRPVLAVTRRLEPVFREVALQLGLGKPPSDPAECARAILAAATANRAAIVASLPLKGTWDHAVAEEIARASCPVLVVFAFAATAPTWEAASFEIAEALAASDKQAWFSAIAEDAQRETFAKDLESLEGWWATTRHVAPTGVFCGSLGDAARQLLAGIVLARCSVRVVTLLVNERAALLELATSAIVTTDAELITLSTSFDGRALEAEATNAARLTAARFLLGKEGGTFEPDPWAYARAAELLLGAGSSDEADAAITKATHDVADAQAAGEMTDRWFAAVAPLTDEVGFDLRMRAAKRALALGDATDARRWCESAAVLRPDDPKIALLTGRAWMQLGDLVAARVALNKARLASKDDAELSARVFAELAEVSFLGGEIDRASEHAQKSVTLAVTSATRLAGRNTLGKLHLAAARWDVADEHFAEDALAASCAGDGPAELRARLNRAIAQMSKGLLDDARAIFEQVLVDGQRIGADRACAHAHSNLGLVAYRQHDYGGALLHWEATTRFPQALRGRIATTLTLANLAELRLRLGLIDHAEHAVLFGRKLLAGAVSPGRSAHFKWVSAQVALARKNTELARREIDSAILDAEASRDREYLDIASIVAARIALEDGDLVSTAAALAKAEPIAAAPRAKAELAIVRALYLRALGQDALETAKEALAIGRAAGDEDLVSEIHSVLAMLHRDAGDLHAAQVHCARAIAIRDELAAGLSADIRPAYLAKPENVALGRLQASLADHVDAEDDSAARPRVLAAAESDAREIIGVDPQIQNLLVAIRKVAKSESTVLIRGESGTGKELVAEALHRESDRAAGPLVSVNCAALVETLLLSELFGHEKGAFTGASQRRRGRFELAEGGTLFLDEIGDISPRTQVALLRVLQEKTFERVGGTQSARANVRVVCATHRDLRTMVDRGMFREDLYYRLTGITLEVPALRARIGDLPRIADALLARIAGERNTLRKTLAQDAIELLQRHRWPGNIRELDNVLRGVSLFADGDAITAADLVENVEDLRVLAQSGSGSQPPSARAVTLQNRRPMSAGDSDDDESDLPEGEANATAVAYAQVRHGVVSLSAMKRQIERDCIVRALAETRNNITRAAALLGMKRPRLSQLVKQYGLSATSEGSQ